MEHEHLFQITVHIESVYIDESEIPQKKSYALNDDIDKWQALPERKKNSEPFD